jgi:hypothetical protein
MFISHTHKFVFIKNRKIGGSSLEKYLIDNHFDENIDQCTGSTVDSVPWYNLPNNSRGHMDWNSIIHLNPKAKDYNVFAIERNPWDKVVSQYFFFRDKIKKIPNSMTFSEFLKTRDFPIDKSKYIEANPLIIKWEHINDDLPLLFRSYGFEMDVEKFKSYNLKAGLRKDSHYSEMYTTDEQIEIVRNAFNWEVENLKYEFEDHR